MKKLIIQKGSFFDKFAYLEDDKLKNIKFINKKQQYFEKDIFLAKKKKENPAMKSLELYLDSDTNGFMHYKNDPKKEYLLCQIKKIYNNDKNPKLTDEISLLGKYAVVMRGEFEISLSSKIKDKSIKEDFEKIIKIEDYKNRKIVIRTNCKKEDINEAQKEIQTLSKKLDEIEKKSSIMSKPQMIYRQYTAEEMFLSKLNTKIDLLITNSKDVFENFKDSSFDIKEITLEKGKEIFDKYNLNFEVENLLGKKVKLENNINIFIEKTEAMNIIDVNSAGFFKYRDKRKNAFYINNFVLEEIVNQIILRDLSGIILIDFIDMNDEKLSKKLLENMNNLLQKDIRKSKAVSLTRLSLMQIVRKKEDLNLNEQLLSKEQVVIKSDEYISQILEDKIKNLPEDIKQINVYLPCFSSDEIRKNIQEIEKRQDIKIKAEFLKNEDFSVKIENVK